MNKNSDRFLICIVNEGGMYKDGIWQGRYSKADGARVIKQAMEKQENRNKIGMLVKIVGIQDNVLKNRNIKSKDRRMFE